MTAGGIFSPDGIDKGTAVLLAERPAPGAGRQSAGHRLRVGPDRPDAGARTPPARRCHAVDVNDRCHRADQRQCRRRWVWRNVRACLPDEVDPPTCDFDTIWSNPPIRIGKSELHELLMLWLPRLAPGGHAWLVVQKNLGSDSLQRWLADELPAEFTVSAAKRTSKAFRILRIRPA